MSARPLVSVYSATTGKVEKTAIPLPAVFSTPIRSDIVQSVFVNLNKNRRQANGVNVKAGHQTAAESWGTGRAVSRIPRVPGGGTHRAGQGAFGNMCRKGHMFSPKKTWRRWHRKVNINTKRFAVAAAVAASGVAPLVLARGHRVANLPEVPLVVSRESLNGVSKTKQAVEVLKKIGAYDDVVRVRVSKRLRAGKGKMRNRRFIQRKGPLVVYKSNGAITRAFRNIPGVDLVNVERLNLLQLAPGGHLGRFVIWTSDAFKALDAVFGPEGKKGFVLPTAKLSNASISRILKSEEIKAVLRKTPKKFALVRKKNPLRNFGALLKLNPYAAVTRKAAILRQRKIEAARALIAKKVAAKAAGKALPPAKKAAVASKKTKKPVPAAKPNKLAVGKKLKAPTGLFAGAIKRRQNKKLLNGSIKKARAAFAGLLFS